MSEFQAIQPTSERSSQSNTSPRGRLRLATFLGGGLLLVTGYMLADYWIGVPQHTQATYVGRGSCIECHQPQAQQFVGSFHDRAMDLATEETVLGDFNDVELEHHGITSRMFRRDGKFMIHTEGPDGQLADFEIKYVFGVDPLQQYMVEFDPPADATLAEIGRVQVLRVSWDTNRKRWFHLDPPDVHERLAPGDDLHWTGISQRWNTMCADCHSTNLQRNFDPHSRTYHTTFSEIDVSCEACHGPGSVHVGLASVVSPFWDRQRGYGLAGLRGPSNVAEVESCAQCHSRRRIVHPDFRPGEPLHDYFATESLHRLAYHADGSNLDEVYEYGSFTQSKMFHKNVRCSDCHNPHSTKLKFSGNKVCTSCHQHPASKYDSPQHHHHKDDSPGASCVECHMPETTYMEVDPRRDHGLRVPRPDLSVQHGTPNACTQCHLSQATPPDVAQAPASAKRSQLDQWCAEATAKWYKPKLRKEDLIVPALIASRTGHPSAQKPLSALVHDNELPAIVRATAVMELGPFAREKTPALRASLAALKDPSPQVRAAAIGNLEGMEAGELRRHGLPLLSDSSRWVRIEAVRVMARLRESLNDEDIVLFDRALEEYFQGLDATNDVPGSHLAHGTLYEHLGRFREAEASYRLAMQLDPAAAGARSNLAALLEHKLDTANDPTAIQNSIKQLRTEELERLERDARLAPENGPLQHRLGLLYHLLKQPDKAEQALTRATDLEPNESHFHWVLALLLQEHGQRSKALHHARAALALWPNDQQYRQTVDSLVSEE